MMFMIQGQLSLTVPGHESHDQVCWSRIVCYGTVTKFILKQTW